MGDAVENAYALILDPRSLALAHPLTRKDGGAFADFRSSEVELLPNQSAKGGPRLGEGSEREGEGEG